MLGLYVYSDEVVEMLVKSNEDLMILGSIFIMAQGLSDISSSVV